MRETGGANRGKYVETYLEFAGASPGEPWCAAFVAYRIHAAAKKLGEVVPRDFPRSAWSPSYPAWGQREDLWVPRSHLSASRLRVGDLACFYFAALERVAHIGIIVGLGPGHSFETVEGNTGPGGSIGAVNRDGDGVYRKRRTLGDLGVRGGIVRLDF